jgi:hypothetical protein
MEGSTMAGKLHPRTPITDAEIEALHDRAYKACDHDTIAITRIALGWTSTSCVWSARLTQEQARQSCALMVGR